jgi:CRISPR/Cas system-associated exonuclease Cas4 (RecB family)
MVPLKPLTKSKLMRGYQCRKSLYLTVHRPELEPPITPEQRELFEQGNQIGALAHREFPNGILVKAPIFKAELAAQETRALLDAGHDTLFEATFFHDGIVVRVDILHRRGAGWTIVEVKSSTRVKPEHLLDVATQWEVCTRAGLEVVAAEVMYVNRESVAPDLDGYFHRRDVTALVKALLPDIRERVAELKQVLGRPEPPDTPIGPHCVEPYECPFKAYCWRDLPKPSLFDLPGLYEQRWTLLANGHVYPLAPDFPALDGVDARRLEALRTGRRWIDREAVRAATAAWGWPRRYLDFETISSPLPVFPGTHPYEQVPFQFSCLEQDAPGATLRERAYLHDDSGDPRPKLVGPLVEALGNSGPIFAYNMKFEEKCLEALARHFPEHAEALRAAVARLVDPLPILRAAVYDPGFGPSFSIKSVAPVLLGSRTYDELGVRDGLEAQRAFRTAVDRRTAPARRERLRQDLLEYCRKDTEEMVRLVEWLENAAREP